MSQGIRFKIEKLTTGQQALMCTVGALLAGLLPAIGLWLFFHGN